MNKSVLNESVYYAKVYGGWLGKNIGGTLGSPVEGKMEKLELTFYPVLPGKPLENDDLDLQLVSLHALEEYGVRLTAKELGQEWLEHVFFPSDEYGYALANLRRGLRPPVSGWFNNPFADCMGSPIRSEIWAMSAPGAPGVAAYYAYQDAIVDHAGGEGVYGEMFFAAIQSAAFLETNRDRLIETGLSFIPKHSRTARAVMDLLEWHRAGKTWEEARALVLKHHGNPNFTDAPQNIAFTMVGWLYGQDFGDSLLKAVNCGYDTDCTAATLGAILGIAGGAASIPEAWVKPIGHSVVLSPMVKGFAAPADLAELTARTLAVSRSMIAEWEIPLAIDPDLPATVAVENMTVPGHWKGDYDPRGLLARDIGTNRFPLSEGARLGGGAEVEIDFGADGPAIGQNARKQLRFTLRNGSSEAWEGSIALTAPASWGTEGEFHFRLEAGEELRWEAFVQSSADLRPFYDMALLVNRRHDGSPWNTHAVRFTLIPAAHWELQGPESGAPVKAVFSGNRIAFAESLGITAPGTYRARTALLNPLRRKVRLIAATAAPVKAFINGILLFENLAQTDDTPAYHRSPSGKWAELELPEGEHRLEIVAEKGILPLEIYVLAVSPWETATPGPCYYLTDILYGFPAV